MAAPTIEAAEGVSLVTLKSDLTVSVGELIGFDGTDWVKADADGRIRAEGVAMVSTSEAGLTIPIARSGVIFDADAPYTKGAKQYLSATAGAHTETIPAMGATLTLLQVIGVAASTERVIFDCARRGPELLRVRVVYDPASLAGATARSDTVTGLATTDVVRGVHTAVLTGTGWDGGLVIQGMDVSAANTLRIRLVNPTAGALDGASVNLDVYVERP